MLLILMMNLNVIDYGTVNILCGIFAAHIIAAKYYNYFRTIIYYSVNIQALVLSITLFSRMPVHVT